MKPPQDFVIPTVCSSNLVGKQKVRVLLSETCFRRVFDHYTHATVCVRVGDRITAFLDYADIEVHLAGVYTVYRNYIEAALFVPLLGNLIMVYSG